MTRPAGEQERDIKDQLRKAKGHPDKTGSLRKNTLKRLIDLTHSPHPNLKIIAAQNISFFFTDFPELEEEAINAVYDLCEDQTPSVRIEGYTAVTELSRANNRLVSRNADVLLQLLQSDERDEVEIVKNALLEHLEMDAKVTLGVFCDQMAPLDESMDDEEKEIRDRLRKVVLKFLTQDARKVIVERHAVPGSEAEETLIDNLLAVIPKLAYKDVEIIVEELFLKLKAFKSPSSLSRGSDILKVLLNKVTELLSKAGRSDGAALLRSAQPYLDLAGFMVVEKRVAPAILLLREYCSSFANKVNLQKFQQDDQQLVVCRLAETFAAANEQCSSSTSSLSDDGASLDALSRALRLSEASPSRHIKACILLLQACQQSLVPQASTSEKAQEQVTFRASASQSTINDKGRPASLPERPVISYPARRMHIASSSRFRDHRPAAVETPIPQASTATSVKHSLTLDLSTRSPKRQKGGANDDSESDSGPSLLSRMRTTFSNNPNPRTNLASTTTPRTTAQRPHSDNAPEPAPPNGELSIRGAAKMGGRNVGYPNSRRPQPGPTPSFSLLERLESPTASVGDGRGWGMRRAGR
ncbi:hypothetical protein C0995_010362 [Termitomyces sp. Mi166|nr:hypothetical protein C0995_010362 [Termitomyces sp. Mi166\